MVVNNIIKRIQNIMRFDIFTDRILLNRVHVL